MSEYVQTLERAEGMSERSYYNVTLSEAARQFDAGEEYMRLLVQRGALEAQVRDGQWWVHLGPRRNEVACIRLWHGTSKDCLDGIVENGFWTVTGGRQTWLTTKELRARLHAIGRARQRHSVPVLLECEVDLEKYPIFWKRSSQIYVFHQPLGPEVIKSVQEVDPREQSRRYRMETKRKTRKNSVNVAVTKNSGALGILLWINTYLDSYGLAPVGVENAIVRGVVQWVEQQYREGHDGPIREEELEERVARLLQNG